MGVTSTDYKRYYEYTSPHHKNVWRPKNGIISLIAHPMKSIKDVCAMHGAVGQWGKVES